MTLENANSEFKNFIYKLQLTTPSSVNPCQARYELGAKGRGLKFGRTCLLLPMLKMAVPML